MRVLWHDDDTLGVNGAQVCVREENNEVSLRGLVQSHDGRGLEAKVCLEATSDPAHLTMEGELSDKKIGTLLIAVNLTEGYGSRSQTQGLLASSSNRSRLANYLGGQLLAGRLGTVEFPDSLFGASQIGDEQLSVPSEPGSPFDSPARPGRCRETGKRYDPGAPRPEY